MKNSFELINKEFKFSYEEINMEINNLIKTENKFEGNIKITYGVQ